MKRLAITMMLGVSMMSCVASRGGRTRPEDMTAREHRDAAETHDQIARQAPFIRRRESGRWWAYYWDSGAEHLAERDAHLDAAETLEARHRAACDGLPIAAESTSPFERYGLDATAIDGGVVVRLSPDAGPAETVLGEIRCHWSWLQLAPRHGAADDLVAIDGLVFEAVLRDETLEVTVTAADPDVIAELQRRATLAVDADR